MIEVFSHRLGAQTDMYFVLKNLATKQDIVLQDDNPESLSLALLHRQQPRSGPVSLRRAGGRQVST